MPAALLALEGLFHEHYGRLLAGLVRQLGDLERAEEALQDAFLSAAKVWPSDGLPERPQGWLLTTARNRAIDGARREALGREKLEELRGVFESRQGQASLPRAPEDEAIPDERLRLIFTCCHPALAHEARVALTLNTLCGLTVHEIARAFLLAPTTLGQRLVRAKRKIREANIPYTVPKATALPERLPAVLEVLYLVFNEGHAAHAGPALMRFDLCREALRLLRSLTELLSGEPEAEGLMALMLLQHARRDARVDAKGRLVRLPDQDRSLWDLAEIESGLELIERALRRRRPGPYQIQAAIAALHARAARAEDTDWNQIVLLYDHLLQHWRSPVVELNRAVAVAEASGAAAAMPLVQALSKDTQLTGYLYLHSTLAELSTRLGDRDAAKVAWQRALELATNETERAFVREQLAALD